MGNVRWRGYDHPQMYEMINGGSGKDASTSATEYWEGLSKSLDSINTDLNNGLSKLKVGWEGEAAESAQGGLNPLQQWSTDAQSGSDVMKISSEFQAQYVSDARNEMPKPLKVTTPEPGFWDKALGAMAGPGGAMAVAQQSADHEQQEAAQQAAAQKAVNTMQSYQSNSEANGNSLGTFVPAPDVVVSVTPNESQHVTHVSSQNQITPSVNDGGGSTTPSGFTGSPSPGAGNTPTFNGGTSGPITSSPTGPSGTVSPINGPVGSTTPQGLVPTNTNPSTNPHQTLPTGPGQGGLPNETGGKTPRPTLPTNPTGPVSVEPETPIKGKTPPGSRGPLGPGEPGPGQNGPGRNGGNRGGLPRSGGPGGDKFRNPNNRLRPSAGPNAFEEGNNGRGTRPGMRGGNGFAYGEESGGRPGGGGVGGRGAGAEGGRTGSRLGRPGAGGPAEEGRVGGRSGGTRGAGGRMGRGQHGEEEEDYEYQHADYLVDTEDVFLDDRLVAPPVIGERPGK